jgi:hypothetical protein
MLTVNEPAPLSTGQVVDVRVGLNVTSAGCSDRDAKDWQVKPAGPSGVDPVMMVSPLANVPKMSRSRLGARSEVTVMEMASRLDRYLTKPSAIRLIQAARNAPTRGATNCHARTSGVIGAGLPGARNVVV